MSPKEHKRVVLQWLPLFAEKIHSSPRYRKMLDYQQAWYMNLLMSSWLNSENPGYLRNDDQLMVLANARTKSFWESQKSVVLACFQTSPDALWVFNAKLLQVYEIQLVKYWKTKQRKRSLSLSDVDCDVELELDFKPSDSDFITEKIVRRHPGNWHLKNSLNLPQAHLVAVMDAIIRNGREAVEQGTETCAAVAEGLNERQRGFIPNPMKFFSTEAYYLKSKEFWERLSDGNSSKKQEGDEAIRRAARTVAQAHGG